MGEGWGKVKECHTVLSEVGERARGKNLLHEIKIKKGRQQHLCGDFKHPLKGKM